MAVAKKKKVMKFRQSLFWDVNPRKINPKRHAKYIIERVLDFGDDREARWVFNFYSPRMIKSVIKKSRVLHDKSKALWSLILK